MTKRLLIIACLTCAVMPLRLSASCAPPPSLCEQLAQADLVFIADVLGATSVERTDGQGRHYPDGITTYRFNVLEGLKGIKAGEFRAQFYFNGGADFDSFGGGRRYLILANRAVTGIYRSACGLSREITKTGEREGFPAVRAELDRCLKKP